MRIPRAKLGLRGEGHVDVVNLKVSPEMIPSLLQERGVFPAYHMSKTHWVTVVTDGAEASASDEMVAFLTEVSFTLTARKKRK
jgi:predicted DNA-binding protein (MmcQ/YjbR family)